MLGIRANPRDIWEPPDAMFLTWLEVHVEDVKSTRQRQQREAEAKAR